MYVAEFRAGYDTFWSLVRQLGPYIDRQDTRWRGAITDPHRVAITLYRLAHGASFHMLQSQLGVGVSTANYICAEVTTAIVTFLHPRYIRFPSGDRLHLTMNRFLANHQMHMCVGALDGSHIPIIAPHHFPEDYRNRKGFHSINLQGCVDYAGLFIDIFVGFPGMAPDSRVFRHSSFSSRIDDGTLFPSDLTRTIQGVHVPPHILADPAYGLHRNVMKGFTGRGHTQENEYFTTITAAMQNRLTAVIC